MKISVFVISSLSLSVCYEMFGVSLHSADETVCMWVSPFMFPAFSIPFTCKGDGEARKEKSWQEGAGCFQRLKNCCMKWESEKSSYLRMTCFLSVCKCLLDNVLKSERLCIRWFRSWHAPSLTHTYTGTQWFGIAMGRQGEVDDIDLTWYSIQELQYYSLHTHVHNMIP